MITLKDAYDYAKGLGYNPALLSFYMAYINSSFGNTNNIYIGQIVPTTDDLVLSTFDFYLNGNIVDASNPVSSITLHKKTIIFDQVQINGNGFSFIGYKMPKM